MNETSRLAIVVDTRGAQEKLKAFTRDLRAAEEAGRNLGGSASNASAGLNSQADAAHKSRLQQDQLAISSKKVEAQNNRTASSVHGLVSAELRAAAAENNRQKSAVQLVTAGKQQEAQNHKTATSAAQLAIKNQQIIITAEQLATAQFKTVTASNNAAASNNRLAVSANQVIVSNNRVTTSASQAAAAATREQIATVNLARANWSLVTAATASANAEQRLIIQTNNAAASAARAEREVLRLAQAQARAAAAANGHAGAMNRASGASRTLYQDMNKLYTVMNSGLVIYGGLGFVKVAADMQNLNNQIRLVTDSEREYLGMKKEVMAIANENYNDVASTISLYQKSVRALTNLGKSQADALKFTEAVSLAMRTGGRSAGEQAAAILQLGQAMGAGVIMGDEFRSISENAPVLLELVAKKMGVLQGDLKKLSADGKITAEIMYEALTENMGALEKLATNMPLTMGQAFIVAKNKFKEYTDDMMNQTGGVSDKISGMLVKISDNFDTIAKVGIAAVTLGLVGMIAKITTATTAMALFNAVTSKNKLVLIAAGFIAVNSAIFDTNSVLTISGIMMGDFFEGMSTMLSDGSKWWMEFSDTVATAMGITVEEVAEANDKNSKNFLGFYETTEKGFAGVVQGLGSGVSSVTAIFGAFFVYIKNGMADALNAMANGAINTFNWISRQAARIGIGDGEQKEKFGYNNTSARDVLIATQSNNQEYWRNYARRLNNESGVTPAVSQDKLVQNMGESFAQNFSFGLKLGVDKGIPFAPAHQTKYTGMLARGQGAFNAPTYAVSESAKLAYENRQSTESSKGGKSSSGKGLDTSGFLEYANKGASRNLKLSDDLAKRLSFLEDANVKLVVTSGGQKRGVSRGVVGSSAHNDGMAADGDLYQEGRKLDWNNKNDLPLLKAIVEEAAARGINGIGAGNDYMGAGRFHFGIQNKSAAWGGKNKKASTAHVMPWVKQAHAAGLDRKMDDSFFGKYQKREQSAIESDAKEERRLLEEQYRMQKELLKKYASERAVIESELQDELKAIEGSGLDDTSIALMSAQAKKVAQSKYDAYVEGLNRQVDALSDSQKTERELLRQTTEYAKFDAKNNTELMKEENASLLESILAGIDAEFAYKEDQLELSLSKQRRELDNFNKTDRELWQDSWDEKIAIAIRATDELGAERLAKLFEQKKQEDALLKLDEQQNLLDLQKTSMGAGEYLLQTQNIELGRIANTPMTEERRRLEEGNARRPLSEAMQGVSDALNPVNPLDALREEYEAQLEIVDAYESQYTNMLGAHSKERVELTAAYERERAQLMLSEGQSIFGSLASASKDMLGEQSRTYRLMFGLQQSFVLASAGISMFKAISDMMADGVTLPDKLAAASVVATQFGTIISSVAAMQPKGFKTGGYTGGGGVNDIAGVVHGKEYVFDAKATRDIGVSNLDAMRSGKGLSGADVFNINVTITGNGEATVTGDNERMGRDIANGMKAVVLDVMRKEKRQGGLLYG